MVNKTNMRLTVIILCLALVLGLIIFFSTSHFLNQPEVEKASPENSLSKKPKAEESSSEKSDEPLPIKEEPSDELQTQAKLTKAISKHANQIAENDLLRYQAEKLEQEIQQKLQSLEEKKP